MNVVYLPSRSKPPEISTRQEPILSVSQKSRASASISKRPVRQLVTARRLDLAVKHRFFRHLRSGGDEGAAELYRWHIAARMAPRMGAGLPTDAWKKTLADYVSAAETLFASMVQAGFDARYPIPVDPEGELLNGSHRVACALALGIAEVPVEERQERIWAPAWDAEWFRAHGLDEETIAALEASLSQ